MPFLIPFCSGSELVELFLKILDLNLSILVDQFDWEFSGDSYRQINRWLVAHTKIGLSIPILEPPYNVGFKSYIYNTEP